MTTASEQQGAVRQARSGTGGGFFAGDEADSQLSRWGGVAGLAGVASMLGAFVVVGVGGLPDASDVETLRDFADIEAGRIAEHFLYLGAVVLFALHAAVLGRLLASAHRAAALFGTILSLFGLVIMAAGSLLHVSTSPLAELHDEPAATPGERQAIEAAWHGAQSVFDTMLATGVLLVPIGIVLFGLAMWQSTAFGHRLATFSAVFGLAGTSGAVVAIIDPGSAFSAVSVIAVTVFVLVVGRRMLKLGDSGTATTGPSAVRSRQPSHT